MTKIALDRDELTFKITNQTNINQTMADLELAFQILKMSLLDIKQNDDYLNDANSIML
jgi:hypothetical protein